MPLVEVGVEEDAPATPSIASKRGTESSDIDTTDGGAGEDETFVPLAATDDTSLPATKAGPLVW